MKIKELQDTHARILASVDPVLGRVRDLSEAYTARKQTHRFSLFSSTNHERLGQIGFVRSVAENFDYYTAVPDNISQLKDHTIALTRAKPVIYGACLYVMAEIESTYYLGSPSSSQLYSELDDIVDIGEYGKIECLKALKEHLSDEDNQDTVNFASTSPTEVLEKLTAYTAATYAAYTATSVASAAP